MLEQNRPNGVMTLMFQGQVIAKIKIQRKKKIMRNHTVQTNISIVYLIPTNVVYQMNVYMVVMTTDAI